MDEAMIIDVLKEWNVWEKDIDAGIKRPRYTDRIYSYFTRKEIIALKGIRRSGKSTIMRQIMLELVRDKVSKKQVLYLNLEDYNFANSLNIKLFDEVLSAYRKYSGNKGKVYFFIDEIQKVLGWEKWLRTQYDRNENMKFVITGSSASLLSKEFSTLLTGRNLSFKIMPLSFAEFLNFSKSKKLGDYLKFGGFPEVVLEDDENKKLVLLQQYFEDIVHKDIIDRYDIRNAKQLHELARYLIGAAGSKVSLNKLAHTFGLSKDTIALYLSYMIDAYLLHEVAYFSYSAKVRHDVSRLPKIYTTDNGLINAVSIGYLKNRGQVFENTVCIKLLEQYDSISYWSNLKSEVDFIVGKTAINVTATDDIAEREMKGLEEFKAKHKNFSTLLVTESKACEGVKSLKEFLLSELSK